MQIEFVKKKFASCCSRNIRIGFNATLSSVGNTFLKSVEEYLVKIFAGNADAYNFANEAAETIKLK